MSIQIKPKGYHIDGLLKSGYDETVKGQEVENLSRVQNLYPTFHNQSIEYSRVIPYNPSDIVNSVKQFVSDVHNTSSAVDKMILTYLSVPRKLPDRFKSYLPKDQRDIA